MSPSTNPQPEPLLVSPREAARILSLSKAGIYLLIQAGVLPAVRMGKMLRIPMSALRELATGGYGRKFRQASLKQ